MRSLTGRNIEELLIAVGELLEARGAGCSVVVVGGAALSLLGLVDRTTRDVDVVAKKEAKTFLPPDPLPQPLVSAIKTVARDFGLPEDWMNTQIASQWPQELPKFLFYHLEWRKYGGLEVGIVGRPTLIALKLHAAVDRDMESVHYQDLIALRPTEAELSEAKRSVLTQDSGEEFPQLVDEVIAHVRKAIEANW